MERERETYKTMQLMPHRNPNFLPLGTSVIDKRIPDNAHTLYNSPPLASLSIGWGRGGDNNYSGRSVSTTSHFPQTAVDRMVGCSGMDGGWSLRGGNRRRRRRRGDWGMVVGGRSSGCRGGRMLCLRLGGGWWR